MRLLLAGDIGGTKTMLSLVADQEGEGLESLYRVRYISNDYPDLLPMVQHFLREAGIHLGMERDPQPEVACFAIAGPVVQQTARLTNLRWPLLQAPQLGKDLGIPQVALINDFSAIGYGILGLPASDLCTLQTGIPDLQAPIAVLGAGTGLGEAYLIQRNGRYEVFGSEGGHTDFAPRSPLECQLLLYLLQRHERVSVERVVSGQGIVAIYQFLRDTQPIAGSPALLETIRAWEAGAASIDAAAMIANAALEQTDPLAEQTLHLFISAYGAEAGNLALKLLSYGGVYLAGGIAAKLLRLLETGEFIRAFLDKGRMQRVLEVMPIQVVLNAQVGLLGAATYAARWSAS
ncbi:MAG: glucokinase [Cyanobacteriota bacterium]|nr:glucokinase [Cyanobacteriota bacterium]